MRATDPADALVLFGAPGDLGHKMIFPALYAMAKHGRARRPGDRCRVVELDGRRPRGSARATASTQYGGGVTDDEGAATTS